MSKESYSRAYTEVLEIIRYLPEDEYNRISQDRIDYFEENKDQNYKFEFNPMEDLDKQNISREANAIIVTLYRDYFASEKQKEKLRELLMQNENLYSINQKETYPSNVFENTSAKNEISKKQVEEVETKDLIVSRTPWYLKVINKIKNIFK